MSASTEHWNDESELNEGTPKSFVSAKTKHKPTLRQHVAQRPSALDDCSLEQSVFLQIVFGIGFGGAVTGSKNPVCSV